MIISTVSKKKKKLFVPSPHGGGDMRYCLGSWGEGTATIRSISALINPQRCLCWLIPVALSLMSKVYCSQQMSVNKGILFPCFMLPFANFLDESYSYTYLSICMALSLQSFTGFYMKKEKRNVLHCTIYKLTV